MKKWYYSTDGDAKHGPVEESEIRDLLANKELTEHTILWAHGMEKWIPLSQTEEFGKPNQPPELASAIPSPPAAFSVPRGLRPWLLFLGISILFSGITQCLTFIGVVSGIPLIIAGSALLSARTALEEPVEIGSFLEKMRTAIIGMSVIYILGLIFLLLLLTVIIPLIGAALAAHGAEFQSFIHP